MKLFKCMYIFSNTPWSAFTYPQWLAYPHLRTTVHQNIELPHQAQTLQYLPQVFL